MARQLNKWERESFKEFNEKLEQSFKSKKKIKVMYSILGTYREKLTEVIEDGLTKSEARNYLEEYRMSFIFF